MDAQSLEQELKGKVDLTPFRDLPLGLYLVTPNGKFVDCNPKLRQILGLSEADWRDKSIAHFYVRKRSREELLELARSAEPKGSFVENQEIVFNVSNSKIWVKSSCRAIRDDDNENVIGYHGYLVDVTEEVEYRSLFEDVPIGVFRLDKDENYLMVNQSLARMLGYDSPEELLGKHIGLFYAELSRASAIKTRMLDGETDVIEQVELTKKSGEIVICSVFTRGLFTPDNHYDGREGVVIDITTQARYREILDEMPVGMFLLRTEDGKDIVRACNNAFLRIFGCETPDEMIGRDILDMYVNTDDYENLKAEVQKEHEQGRPLVGYGLKVKTLEKEPREFTIEVNVRLLTDKSGQEIGRVGAIRDISDEAALWELKRDVGHTLHTYSSMLNLIQYTIEPVRAHTQRAPFEATGTAPDDETYTLETILHHLKSGLEELLETAKQLAKSGDVEPLLPSDLLHTELLNLADYDTRVSYPELHLAAIHDSATKIATLSDVSLTNEALDELVGNVLRAAEDVERYCCLEDVRFLANAVQNMDYQVRAFRSFVISSQRTDLNMSEYNLDAVILQGVSEHRAFAVSRNVRFDFRNDARSTKITAAESDIVRAFGNIIHNAIKYSWAKAVQPSEVRIHSYVKGDDAVTEISSYGVAITKEEIDQELIFELGYRGVWSGDRGRLGTGVGLHDARDVIRQHDGDITVTARSVATRPDPNDPYAGPFMVIVTVRIPRKR
ncbi:MAG: PAS domain S-box protein [candidate division Zixibacteria bacterium]|nr:PAS domain S-box protein [candidate division Zixibacteria bacterium]